MVSISIPVYAHTFIVLLSFLCLVDVLSNRKMLATLVTKLGIECDMCVDGLDALNTVTKGKNDLDHYQIIFMDFTMPNLVSMSKIKYSKKII